MGCTRAPTGCGVTYKTALTGGNKGPQFRICLPCPQPPHPLIAGKHSPWEWPANTTRRQVQALSDSHRQC